jgi:hypothetical protein
MTTILSSPDGLTEAKRLKAAYEAQPRVYYDGSQQGDMVWFEASLDAALERTRLRNEMRRLIAQRLEQGMRIGGNLTAEQLRKHAARFGPEMVAETAVAAGIDVRQRSKRQPAPARRQRRSSQQITQQVLELRGRGLVVSAIADSLNISDRRARQIIAATTATNGSTKVSQFAKPHQLSLNHAGLRDPISA